MILGEVKNVGSTATFVKAKCNLFDFDGNLLETETTYISGSVVTLTGTDSNTNTALNRNDVGVYKAWTSTAATSVDDVRCKFSYDTYATKKPLANLEVSGNVTRRMDGLGNLKLTGFVKNTGSKGLTFGQIIFAIKNSAGALLDLESTYIDGTIVTLNNGISTDTALRPGASGTFDLITDISFSTSYKLESYVDWSDTRFQNRIMGKNSVGREALSKKEKWEERDRIIDELRKQLEVSPVVD